MLGSVGRLEAIKGYDIAIEAFGILRARLPDPDNPFREFRWYVPVTVSAGLPFAVPFMGGNAAHRWRH